MTAPDLHPDHARLIQLANAAFKARDNRELWNVSIPDAAEKHGAACNALWDELERQATIQDGRIPTLEHPTVRYRRMVAQMRSEIINHMADALYELEAGPALESDGD